MITSREAVDRMQEADPVPTLDAVPDELVASVRATIGARRAGQTDMASPTPVRPVAGRLAVSWSRPAVAVAMAFVVTVAIIGAAAVLRSDDAPVGEATTTLNTTAVTTAAPDTSVPATTVPAAPTTTSKPATATIPEKPASLEIAWERVPPQPALEDGWISAVTAGGPGYVAVGGTVGCSDPVSDNCRLDAAVWLSPDGLTWERIESATFRGDTARENPHGEPTDGDQYMNDVTQGPAGLVAVGAAPVLDPDRVVGYLDRVGIWLSPDGRQWERLPHDEDVFGGQAELRRVTTLGDRLVVIGGDRATAWSSRNGRSWERATIDLSPAAEVLDLTVWNEVLVAVGKAGEYPAVWVSEDGATWTRVTERDLDAAHVCGDDTVRGPLCEGSGNLQGVGGSEAGVVALGTDFRTGRTVAWRSPDGIDWVASPEWLGDNQVWQYQARTAMSVERGTGGIEDDLILINGSATLWGTADGGELWYSAGEFDGGPLEVLAGGASGVFNTVNQVLVANDRLLAFGKVVAWSDTEPIGGQCYIDPPGFTCRADAAIWVGTWDGSR